MHRRIHDTDIVGIFCIYLFTVTQVLTPIVDFLTQISEQNEHDPTFSCLLVIILINVSPQSIFGISNHSVPSYNQVSTHQCPYHRTVNGYNMTRMGSEYSSI